MMRGREALHQPAGDGDGCGVRAAAVAEEPCFSSDGIIRVCMEM